MAELVLGSNKHVCRDYARFLKTINQCRTDENADNGRNEYDSYKISFPNYSRCKTDSHPLMFKGSKMVMGYPIMSSLLDRCLNSYLLEVCSIVKEQIFVNMLPHMHYENNINTSNDAFEDLAKKNVISMLQSTNVIDIFNWMSLVTAFLEKENIRLEPFQKLLFMHSVFFMASTRASEHTHLLDRVLSGYFNLGESTWQRNIEDFKKQICAFVVARRQGKTFATVIFISAAMLTLRNTRLAYVAHIRFQSSTVMKDIKTRISQMMQLIRTSDKQFKDKFISIDKINEQQALGTVNIKFADGSETVAKIASCKNKDVRTFYYSFRSV